MTTAAYSTTAMRLDEHREALARLWSDNMGDPRIAGKVGERIAWLYERNPSGPARTWLGLSPAAQVIGCGSLFPRRISVGDRDVNAGVLADFAVDRRHRLAGPAITIQRAIVKGSRDSGFDFVFGWPNAKSVAVVKRVGYAAIGATRTWVKPLRSERKLVELLAPRVGDGAARVAARLGGPVVDRALWANDWRMRAVDWPRARGASVDRADARFDDLWERGRRAMPYVTGDRASSYLNWRYAEFTTARYRFYTLCERRGGRLVGYVAWYTRGDAAFVADVFCDGMEWVDPLLLGCANAVRADGARSLSLTYVGTRAFTTRLGRLGFFDRGGDRPLIVYVDPGADEEWKRAVLDPNRWFMFDGELDI